MQYASVFAVCLLAKRSSSDNLRESSVPLESRVLRHILRFVKPLCEFSSNLFGVRASGFF